MRLTVRVFPMEVDTELVEWPERSERSRSWHSVDEAARKVCSRKLAGLIRSLPRHLD